ncbi:uncharacterized protein B0P05DRAFT_539174 [Gilbertella persicaria]|uniref:uncharacterized protein n=1 Tax=Gilbertella persicaria TaxID=101096 RepID=UPI002220ED30|nr:uncharacterized protein B0P05DRAFT_539174 [Gilbertella persicaria]KAI8080688.1 hypothetical protein B0P05DRAFT_539174 [Gilbertella persicaria]
MSASALTRQNSATRPCTRVIFFFFFVLHRMVNISIYPYINSEKKQELICLDFQGSFDSGDATELDNMEIGDLTLEDDSAVLVIGHHRLVGKKAKLPKPYAVIYKRKKEEDAMEEGTSYDVVTILKEKYVFTGRPGLIVQESLRGLTRIGK